MTERDEQRNVSQDRALLRKLAEGCGIVASESDISNALVHYGLRHLTDREDVLKGTASWDDAMYERAQQLSGLLENELGRLGVEAAGIANPTTSTPMGSIDGLTDATAVRAIDEGRTEPLRLKGEEALIYYEQVLKDVPDRFTVPSSPENCSARETNSAKRLESLFEVITAERITRPEYLSTMSGMAGLLVEFANSQPNRNPAGLHPNQRAFQAAVTWKYLQGAETWRIEGVVNTGSVPYKTTVQNARAQFVLFAKARQEAQGNAAKKTSKDRLIPEVKRAEDLANLGIVKNPPNVSVMEESGARYVRSTETPNTVTLRARVINQLAYALDENDGAYRLIFNCSSEEIAEEAMSKARRRLWDTIVKNVRQKESLSSDLLLNNEEVKWLAPLCGKKLVPNAERKLEPFNIEPLTLKDVRARANFIHAERKQGTLTADEVEAVIMTGLEKLIAMERLRTQKG